MGACSTCLHCGENHWGSCDPAGYGKCNYCGELYGAQTLDTHQRECYHNPSPGLSPNDLPEKVRELEEWLRAAGSENKSLMETTERAVKALEDSSQLNTEQNLRIASLKEQMAALRADLQRSLNEHEYCDEELALTRAEVVAQTAAKEAALAEVERLKAGRFTEEEFQALCHTFQGDDVCRFRQGCTEYQVKLFGERPVALDLARELRWALRQVCMNDPMEGVAEAMATALVRNDPKAKCTEERR